MKSYLVKYYAEYYVQADNEHTALELGIEKHANLPDGDWQVEELENE